MKIEDWCPLFSALPVCKERDGITERCITIITDARNLVFGGEYDWELKSFDPDGIEARTDFRSAWIESARLLCDDSGAILFAAQHWQGYIQGEAWTRDRHEKPHLTYDVDQISEDILLSVIEQRDGIDDQGFLDYLTPEKALALMAIGEAWNLITEIEDGEEPAESQQTAMYLLDAEKLLKAAHAFTSKRLQRAIEEGSSKKRRDTAEGGKKSGESKQRVTTQRNKEWNDMASSLRDRYPKWSEEQIAERIKKETKTEKSGSTIREIIRTQKV